MVPVATDPRSVLYMWSPGKTVCHVAQVDDAMTRAEPACRGRKRVLYLNEDTATPSGYEEPHWRASSKRPADLTLCESCVGLAGSREV